VNGLRQAFRSGHGAGGYRGSDRRHLIARTTRPVDAWWVSAAAAGVVAAPLLAAAFMTGSVLGFNAWETGIGDASLIGYGAAALLLGLRWRFVGDAVCIPFAAAVGVVALGYVPSTIHAGLDPILMMGLRFTSVAVLVILVLVALRYEEVRADLRSVRFITVTFLVTGLAALPFTLWPLRVVLEGTVAGIRSYGVAQAIVALAVAALVAREGVRRQRRLFVAIALMLMTVASASALRAVHPRGPWLDLAALCLLAGAVELVVTISGEFQSAISAVVLHDVRGSRRWEAAEAELDEFRTSVRGRRHDVRNILAGVDGTLHVLSSERHAMPAAEVDRLIEAIRQEVQWLQLVLGDGVEPRSYDLSELLRAIIDVRSTARAEILAEIDPGLIVQGRPDRLAVAIDNLLVNVAVHAQGAKAVVAATRCVNDDVVEVSISDDGPGLLDDELLYACERGWRSERSAGRPGTGLGLAQVHELVVAEGGEVILEPTCRNDRAGRGLTVRLRVPLQQSTAATAGTSAH
jgi:signal transduction histidine kinase